MNRKKKGIWQGLFTYQRKMLRLPVQWIQFGEEDLEAQLTY